MRISPATLRRLEKLEAAAPTGAGNWVIGLSGTLIWDPWDYPEPTAEEGAAALAQVMRQIDQIAERMRAEPNYVPPTEKEKREVRRTLDEAIERMQAEKAKVREFTVRIERERAARAAA
jgi:hypothetical protein